MCCIPDHRPQAVRRSAAFALPTGLLPAYGDEDVLGPFVAPQHFGFDSSGYHRFQPNGRRPYNRKIPLYCEAIPFPHSSLHRNSHSEFIYGQPVRVAAGDATIQRVRLRSTSSSMATYPSSTFLSPKGCHGSAYRKKIRRRRSRNSWRV